MDIFLVSLGMAIALGHGMTPVDLILQFSVNILQICIRLRKILLHLLLTGIALINNLYLF